MSEVSPLLQQAQKNKDKKTNQNNLKTCDSHFAETQPSAIAASTYTKTRTTTEERKEIMQKRPKENTRAQFRAIYRENKIKHRKHIIFHFFPSERRNMPKPDSAAPPTRSARFAPKLRLADPASAPPAPPAKL